MKFLQTFEMKTIQIEDVLTWAKELTYKCDVDMVFESRGPKDPYITMNISRYVPNVDNPSERIVIAARYAVEVKQLQNRDIFFKWAYEKILKYEHHEIDEWFKVKGIAVKHPHKNEY